MTGAGLALAAPATTGSGPEFGHVLDGVALKGTTARLASTLEPGFLAEAGWDPVSRVLADKAYDTNSLRALLAEHGIEPVIP